MPDKIVRGFDDGIGVVVLDEEEERLDAASHLKDALVRMLPEGVEDLRSSRGDQTELKRILIIMPEILPRITVDISHPLQPIASPSSEGRRKAGMSSGWKPHGRPGFQ